MWQMALHPAEVVPIVYVVIRPAADKYWEQILRLNLFDEFDLSP